ncbi:lysozyme inhibitor LprI family protein [Ancylobacter sp.]|uniref:lysozyme inhibitor LprI family protein n=1 Tax=Ancylobacter sp. TaxID=1872567 RepID=UPI003D10CF99
MTHPLRLRGSLAAVALLFGALAPAALAGSPAECRRQNADPRGYLDCLNLLQKTGEDELQRSVIGVTAVIEARADLQPAQRRRWIGLFEESQGRFVSWRNFECQSIAPFEGEGPRQSVGGRMGGAGVIEQRLVCLIGHNERRARDLAARYAPAGGWPAPAVPPPASAPAPAASAAPAVAPRLIIAP